MSTPASVVLADLAHWFGGDLSTSNTGDVQTATGTLRGRQRVVRRLMTNPGADLFSPGYGAGLPQAVGKPLNIPKLQALCIAQVLLESVVAKSPIPTVSISQSSADLTQFTVSVAYTDSPTLTPVVLTFTVSN